MTDRREYMRQYKLDNKDRLKEQRRAYMKRYRETPMYKFHAHRSHAKKRGVEWQLTFEDWWSIWSDYWEGRGRTASGLCMARYQDIGPYAVGNVRIITKRDNDIERECVKRAV